MNQKQLLEIIGAMKHEILDLLQNTNLTNDSAAQRVLKTIDNMFNRLGIAVEDVIPEESLKAYFKGVDEATKALSSVGINPIGGISASISSSGQVSAAFNTHVHLNAIVEITDDTMLDLKAAIRTAKRNARSSIETTLKSVKNDLQSGIIHGDARKVITQRVAESFAQDGMTSFVTIDGKKLPLDFYSQVVTRTNLKKANIDGALSRYIENGIQYVTVSGGTPTCHQCFQYRDIVFSLVDDGSGFPYLPPNTFPLHPNCNCSIRPYVIEYKTESEIRAAKQKAAEFDPNKDTRSESQKKAYADKQDLNRKRNQEKKDYAQMKATLGDEAPKTLGAYRRMKHSGSTRFVELKQRHAQINRETKARMDIVSGKYPKTINQNKQDKHVRGTNGYKLHEEKLNKRGDKPAIMADDINPQDLIDRYSGTGRIIAPTANQPPKESVKIDRNAGAYYNKDTEEFVETEWIMIAYSKTGTHIYPKRGETE